LHALGRAIAMAAPARISRPFVEHAPTLRAYLSQVRLANQRERAFRDHVLHQVEGVAGSVKRAPAQPPPKVRLTWREEEVLALLPVHASNKEIAQELVISSET